MKLADRMSGDIAAEFARRYNMRPRAAWRETYGWSLQDTADRINDFRGNTGLDPGAIASMTAPHLSEYENWPGHGPQPTGRRPTPYLLAVLAAVTTAPSPTWSTSPTASISAQPTSSSSTDTATGTWPVNSP